MAENPWGNCGYNPSQEGALYITPLKELVFLGAHLVPSLSHGARSKSPVGGAVFGVTWKPTEVTSRKLGGILKPQKFREGLEQKQDSFRDLRENHVFFPIL